MSSKSTSSPSSLPLILDLDGTLIRNDTTHDLLFATALKSPFCLPRAIKLGLSDKPAMKEYMLSLNPDLIDPLSLPLQDCVVEFAKAHKASGGKVFICSGTHQTIVDRLVALFDWVDGGWGTTLGRNLTSQTKAEFLEETFPAGFEYVGNSTQDYDVWRTAQIGYAVNPPRGYNDVRSAKDAPITLLHQETGRLKIILKAMRVHQWAKNGLLFVVPLLTIFALELEEILSVLIGFLVFSMMASATYILNDLVDIEADRKHRTKSRRMLASGRLSIPHAVVLMAVLMLGTIGMSAYLPNAFKVVLSIYFIVTIAYSFKIKSLPIADVLTLAGLFSLRVVAGGALIGASVSSWLLNFVAVFFLNLALVKRYVELRKKPSSARGEHSEKIVGRGYVKEDEGLIMAIGVAMAAVSLLSFILYGVLAEGGVLNSGFVVGSISSILLYWTLRVWLLAHRGEMDDDPVLFAVKDKLSLILVAIVGLFIVAEVAGLVPSLFSVR